MLPSESSSEEECVSLVKEPEIGFMGLSNSLEIFSISAPLHRPCGGRNRIFFPLCQWEASWERSGDWIVGRWADAAVGGSLYVCVCVWERGG